ncbi:signal peptidase I [Nocardioides gansuensis]|uniref:Signal peptidase I n=1 Tax=Nocardioides gansuensis TaxID=2138300 RepID=A0A2T8F774_9ACTN|nr:signal peptidase I [Nocardioides gansuensis]PVG81560.1 signal peptidase I [Nocardioides gansuensis]
MSIDVTPRGNRRSRQLRRRLLDTACILVTLLALAFILPSAFGLSRYVITGGSMSGSIERGSVVFAEVVPVADLQVGDVITYVPPAESGIDTLVTHRIIAMHDGSFTTKGDANADVDPWTFELTAATQARVVADLPYLGWPFIALSDRSTRVVVIGVPAGLVALLSLVELARGLRPRRTHSRAGEPAAA